MNRIKIVLAAALIGMGSAAMAAADASTTREQRMDEALQNYRDNNGSTADRSTQPGKFERAEGSAKRGIHKAGAAIDRGVKKVGRAIDNGATKAGGAIRRTGEKMGGTSSPPPPEPK